MVVKNSAYTFPDGEYWMYLRKSRADMEAEARGEGETLSKHRTALLKFARQNNLSITKIFPEIVSGESIFHRPEMVKMLKEMEDGPPKGVLVMDVERLGRGDKIDQGIIEQSFKEANTLIITPSDVYDMNDESGEFNVEVRSFLARMEYKQSKKRMQGGRKRSVEDARNYIGTLPPYGYLIHFDEFGRSLKPHPEQASVVKQIFAWYTHPDPEQRMGSSKIANELNSRGILTYTGIEWEASLVLNILKNEVYFGRLQWGKKEIKKSKTPGKKRESRTRDKSEWIDVRGRFEPLVTEELFMTAQAILKNKYHVPYQLVNGITNPLAGLIRCYFCNTAMVYRPYTTQAAHLKCNKKGCQSKSSQFTYVEQKLIESLTIWLDNYKANWKRNKSVKQPNELIQAGEANISDLNKELKELDGQKGRLHDFLERGIYTEETFLQRSQEIAERTERARQAIQRIKKEIEYEKTRSQAEKEIIPTIEKAIKLYSRTDDPADKNNILKTVLKYAVYKKEKWQRLDDFELILYPLLPNKHG